MDFIAIAAIIAGVLLIWDCFEVGRNDATNIVNAVFGSRVMSRKSAVLVAGFFVVLGATFSSPVMKTLTTGIFDMPSLTPQMAIAIFLAAYLVDTVLLYTYSQFGMPVSTTATLVFSLAGGAAGVALSFGVVQWDMLNKIVMSILASIAMTGIFGFMVQRIFRGAVRHKVGNHFVMALHGPWMTGAILTALSWFLVAKGMKSVELVGSVSKDLFVTYGAPAVLMVYWGFLTLLVHLAINIFGTFATRNLFRFNAIVGMAAMAFAFGQNDLANCASPGLASIWIWKEGVSSSMTIPRWVLTGCGILMFLGMTTKGAHRVTRAAVNTASQYDKVALWAPEWCRALARVFVRPKPSQEILAPAPRRDESGHKEHYDTLRASVIMAVSASTIAFASSLGIPVSTTYVSFAAIVSTGWADRVYGRGDADLKMGRAIWVVTSWFLGAIVAAVAAGLFALLIDRAELVGVGLALGINLFARWFFGRKADAHEHKYHVMQSSKASLFTKASETKTGEVKSPNPTDTGSDNDD